MSTMVHVSFVDGSQQDSGAPSPPADWDLSFSENALLSVYCFVKNFIGAPAGTNTVAIDNKIEQAMDLVKSHLMFAVREEVDVLKERITELVDHITRLEQENTILRANASTETLSMLGQTTASPPVQQINQQQQPQMVPGQHPVTTQTSATT